VLPVFWLVRFMVFNFVTIEDFLADQKEKGGHCETSK
jgi:hypothetical protein